MKIHHTMINGMQQVNGETCLRLELRSLPQLRPGQYIQISEDTEDALLPRSLMLCRTDAESTLFCGEMNPAWRPGDRLRLRGPLGNGFHLPAAARRVVLAAHADSSLNPLLALADQALAAGAEVAVLSDQPLEDLPAAIEVLPKEELPEALNWADFCAFVCAYDDLPRFARQIRNSSSINVTDRVCTQVLVVTDMICAEGVTCGICALPTRKGWRLACKDGPVFDFRDLEFKEDVHG